MKKWLLIIVCLSLIERGFFACGPFYPYGDEVRFSLLKPHYVPVYGMGRFHYTAFHFSDSYTALEESEYEKSDENVAAWHAYFKGEFTHNDIYEVIYKTDVKKLKKLRKTNLFVKALYTGKYKDVLNYLVFAKKISGLNSWSDDPWERKRDTDKVLREKQIKKAQEMSATVKDPVLSRRYTYLGIRLAFYNNDHDLVRRVYATTFANDSKPDMLTYWAMHFKIHASPGSAGRNVEIARVFRYSHEKRFAVHFMYDNEIAPEKVLEACRNQEERTAVQFYLASRKTDRALGNIRDFATHSSDENLLTFLVLREVNKLEDWILTPYYSEFMPSLKQNYYYDEPGESYAGVRSRISEDQQYARELALWMGKHALRDEAKSKWWKSMTAYLYFLSGEKKDLETAREKLVLNDSDPALYRFNAMLSVLITLRETEKPGLGNEQIQQTIRNEADRTNHKFLFAVGRELEFKGNTTDAAYMFSKINRDENWENYTFWRSRKLHQTLFLDFYENYFFYLDAQYSPQEVAALIRESKNNTTSAFDQWKKEEIKKDLPRLYDLLGTKYLRQDKLEPALKAYEQVNDTLWRSSFYPFRAYLDANPFFTDFYAEHRHTEADTIRYTKPEIVRKLMYYLEQIDRSSGKQKAFYSFQVANCYFNMTQYGNSWMMKRYFWTSMATHTGLEDDNEYFRCKLAQKYYLDAGYYTKSEEISALALRMAGRCEKYRLYDEHLDYEGEDYEAFIFSKNKYYKKLQETFPEHYEPLISNCYSFYDYNVFLR